MIRFKRTYVWKFSEGPSLNLFNNHASANDDALWVISWSRRTWLMSAASPAYRKGELITVTTRKKESQLWDSHISNYSIKQVIKKSARRFSILGSTCMVSEAPSVSSQCRYRSTKRGDWNKTVMAKVGRQFFMLLVSCIFLHSLQQPTNALNKIQ
jgi:hypothetical protein